MATYRYLALETLTRDRIAQLPLSNVRFGSILNGAGPLNSQLALPVEEADRPIAALYKTATRSLVTALAVYRDNVPIWSGPMITPAYTSEERSIRVSAAEWWAIIRRRLITDQKEWTNTEQLDIVTQLLAYTQAKTGGALGITVPAATPSGVLRTQTYNYFEHKNLAGAIEDLAALDNGFDFAIDLGTLADDLTLTFNLSYPRRGRIAGDTGLVWSSGNNMISFEWPEDGSQTANAWYGIGAGEGESMLRSSAVRPDLWAGGYPLLEDSIILKDETVQSNLNARTRARLAAKGEPVALPPIKVRGDVAPIVGSYITGDEATFKIEAGFDPFFPDGAEFIRRIVGIDVEPSDAQGQEVVRLTTAAAVST
jgi:hypothetical protein